VRTGLVRDDVEPRIERLVQSLFRNVPCGVGVGGAIPKLGAAEVRRVLRQGVEWALENGYGDGGSTELTEEGGRLDAADPDAVGDVAIERGAKQLGTLGSGNHFLEVDVVAELHDVDVAARLGLHEGQVVFLVHSGSRGLGYQVCDDSLAVMARVMEREAIRLPDRQLACAPIGSTEGERYLAAMAAAANFAWANRQVMTALAIRSFVEALEVSPRDLAAGLVYDVCHNIAKIETHEVEGRRERLCVHRKGATRAFGPGRPELSPAVRDLGQPVLVPGDMGRGSFVCVGTAEAMAKTFGSTCHGAGRAMSRAQSKKSARGRDLVGELRSRGVAVAYHGKHALAEEMPEAYKDVSEVVEVMHAAGVSRKVARLQPIAVIKG
jgi:tRNA-splicing ligase RtcB